MKHPLNEIQRLQRLAGLNERKLQPLPRYKEGQTVYLWDAENDHQIIGTVTNIVKGSNNIPNKDTFIFNVTENEEDEYYYELGFIDNGIKDTVWASESWMEREIKRQELNE
jgi:hypothetical protein